MRRLRGFFSDQRGGTLIEYALICALVILTMFASLNGLAGKVIQMFGNVSNNAGSVL